MTLTPEQLELQLACLYCDIIWEGTPHQVNASVGRHTEGKQDGFEATTISQQLAAYEDEVALRKRRRFRKLWRQYAKRNFIRPEQIKSKATKRHFAYSEALRIYRENQNPEQKEKA